MVTGVSCFLEEGKPTLAVHTRCNQKRIKHAQVIFTMLHILLLNIVLSIALILHIISVHVNSNATPSRECYTPLRKGEQ